MAESFYEKLAADYDRVIRWERRMKVERPLFEALSEKYQWRTVLDTSCGTGHHLILFSQMGLEAWGSDASPEMVELARRNTAAAGLDIARHTFVCKWSELDSCIPTLFDAVLCIGNSLPYVMDIDQLSGSLRGLWSRVAINGVLILQFKNYAKLRATGQRFLPISSSPPPNEMIALRLYDYFPDHIDFNVIMLEREENGWGMRHQVTPLRTYSAEQIQKELEVIGGKVSVHGSLALDPYNESSSEDVVLVAQKTR